MSIGKQELLNPMKLVEVRGADRMGREEVRRDCLQRTAQIAMNFLHLLFINNAKNEKANNSKNLCDEPEVGNIVPRDILFSLMHRG